VTAKLPVTQIDIAHKLVIAAGIFKIVKLTSISSMSPSKLRLMYLWDFEFQFSDLLDFMEFSERNLEWQRRSHVQSLERKAKLKKYEADEYHSELDNIEYRFNMSLARNIRYSAVITFATSIEWIAKFMKKQSTSELAPTPNGSNESIHILRSFFELAGCNREHNLETLAKVIKIRNCITHAMGSVQDYKHGDEIAEIIQTLKGFRISDSHFIERVIDIDQGAIEAIIRETRGWIVDFIDECKQKNLIHM